MRYRLFFNFTVHTPSWIIWMTEEKEKPTMKILKISADVLWYIIIIDGGEVRTSLDGTRNRHVAEIYAVHATMTETYTSSDWVRATAVANVRSYCTNAFKLRALTFYHCCNKCVTTTVMAWWMIYKRSR